MAISGKLDFIRRIDLQQWVLVVGVSLAVLYMGPLRQDNSLKVQWTGYITFGLLLATWCLVRLARRQPIASSNVYLALVGLLAAYIIATIFSIDPRRSASTTAQVAIGILLFMLVIDLLHSGWKKEAWVNALLWASGLVSLLSLLEVIFWYATWYSLGGSAHPLPPFNYRLTSWLGHANMYAGMVIATAPLAAAAWLQDRRPLVRVSLAAWGVMALVNLVFASSRGGWLVLFGTLILFGLLLAAGRPLEGQWLKKIHLPRINWKLAGGVLVGLVILGGVGFIALRMLRNPTHAPLFQSRSGYWPIAWEMFTQSPLVGKGPETYYHFWLAERPFSIYSIAANPINIYLTLAAETGLLGLGAFLLAAGLAAWQAYKIFKTSPPGERVWLSASASALAGILVQGVTEITGVLYPAVLFMIVLTALLAASGRVPTRRLPAWLPLGMLAILAGFGLYAGRAQFRFEQALKASGTGQWQRAADLAEQAARMDPDFAWYWLQAGYARGKAALESADQPDQEQLRLAVSDYQTGITLEPAYALNHANLAVLFWQTGDQQSALEQMNQAVEHDPNEGVYLFNLGWMQEALGDLGAAQASYTRALQATPALVSMSVWNTAPRRAALQSVQTDVSQAPGLDEEIRSMSALQLEEARLQYQTQQVANPFAPLPYRGLGLIAWQNGDLATAEYDLTVSTRAPGDFRDKYTRLEALLDLSDLYASQEQANKAASAGLQAFDAIDLYNLSGPGSRGYNPYAYWVFHREGFTSEVLPGLVRPDMSRRLALRFVTLGSRLLANNQVTEACRVYRRVLVSVPDLAEASDAVRLFCK